MGGEKKAIFAILNKIAATPILIGDNRTSSGKGFDGSDAEWFEAREEIGSGVLQKLGQFGGIDPGDKFDESGGVGEPNEAVVFGAIANDLEMNAGFEASFNSEIDPLPSDLTASDNVVGRGGRWGFGRLLGGELLGSNGWSHDN